jgi:hypothetical protein
VFACVHVCLRVSMCVCSYVRAWLIHCEYISLSSAQVFVCAFMGVCVCEHV